MSTPVLEQLTDLYTTLTEEENKLKALHDQLIAQKQKVEDIKNLLRRAAGAPPAYQPQSWQEELLAKMETIK